MTYKYLLFDFDGTVADTIPVILESFQHVFIKFTGKPVDEAYILSTIGLPLEAAFETLPAEDRQAAFDSYIEYNFTRMDTGVTIFFELMDSIRALRAQGVRTGLVTSKRRKSAFHTIERFDLEKDFDVIVVREDTVRHKPHPDPVYKALEDFEKEAGLGPVLKEEVLFIGDSVHDVLSARSAGLKTVIVDWTYMDKEELRNSRPDYWLYRAKDLEKLTETGEIDG